MATKSLFLAAITFLFILGGLGLGGCAGPHVEVQIAQELPQEPSMTVAVLPFDLKQVRPEPISDSTQDLGSLSQPFQPKYFEDKAINDAGNLVSDMFVTQLVRVPRFKVMERSQLTKILLEQKVSLPGLLATKTAQQIGALLGVDAVVLGNVSEFRYNSNPLGVYLDYSYSMRMVDTKTGAVLISTQVSESIGEYNVVKRCLESVRAVGDKIVEKME